MSAVRDDQGRCAMGREALTGRGRGAVAVLLLGLLAACGNGGGPPHLIPLDALLAGVPGAEGDGPGSSSDLLPGPDGSPVAPGDDAISDAGTGPDAPATVQHGPDDPRLLLVKNGAVHVAFTDGTGARQISPDGWFCKSPSWSPDGQKVAFISSESGHNQLYVTGRDGGQPTLLVPWAARYSTYYDDMSYPTWSRDNIIAYGYFVDYASGGAAGVDLVNADGSDVRIGPFYSYTSAPAWSPDGKALAADGSQYAGSLVVWRDDGSIQGTTVELANDAGPIAATWLPSGEGLVYLAQDPYGDQGPTTLYRIQADGTALMRVAILQNGSGRPSVSRDGRTVAVTTYPDGWGYTPQVMAVDLETGATSMLADDASDPVYQP
jgi:Tol biopolymer transport system component